MKLDTLRRIYPVVFLTAVVFILVVSLSWTDNLTRDKIAWQEEQKIKRMLEEMFPGMSEYTYEDEIYTIYIDAEETGYAFLAVGKGYGGKVNILVGLEDEKTLKGISIISQTETPGLGDRITKIFFTDRFARLSLSDVSLRQDGGQIDAITGATISSEAIIDAVRTQAMEKVKLLKDNGREENTDG